MAAQLDTVQAAAEEVVLLTFLVLELQEAEDAAETA
jgi:hypothetical protein